MNEQLKPKATFKGDLKMRTDAATPTERPRRAVPNHSQSFAQALESKQVSIDYPPTPLHELTARWPWLKLPWRGPIANCKHRLPSEGLRVLDVVCHMYDDHFLEEPGFLKWLEGLESKMAKGTLKRVKTAR
jgi:hypothetical protein